MSKCHCAMCGYGRPGRISRTSYARAGVITDEKRSKGADKVRERRLRRRRELRAALAGDAGW